MTERRSCTRSRVLRGAKLIVGTTSVLDCTVRDLTCVGARVRIPHALLLPEHMDLTLDQGRTLRACRTAWRTEEESGLQFVTRHNV